MGFQMNTDYRNALVSYRISMSLAEDMLLRGIISERDYSKIDRIIAKKYGLSLDSICCRNPLLSRPVRGNMSLTRGGDIDGTDD